MSANPSPSLRDLLRDVRSAARVEQGPRGQTREQRDRLAALVDQRILDAARAGATTAQLSTELGVGISRAQQRLRLARIAASPTPEVLAPNVVLAVPQCHRPAPPPWPVMARCRLDAGHGGDHDFDRLR